MKNKIQATQKACFLIASLLCIVANIHGANYYFSSSGGDDSRSSPQAQNAGTPWKTINKLNLIVSQLNPGDSVLFKSGEVFYGSVIINRSGNSGSSIIFSSYGGSSKPRITGFTTLSNWNNAGGNVWETTLPAAQQNINSVLVNGSFRRVGRYPNADAANSGYLTLESTQNNNSITDLQLSATPNWNGGEVVIRKVRWVLDRNVITQHIQNTISYISQSGYGTSPGYGYFIQNHPGTLDQNTEWYYQAGTRKFGMYSQSGAPVAGSVEVSTIQSLVSIINQANITFSNLIFSGANDNAFYIRSSQNIKVNNCEVLFSGHDAINALNTNYISVENTTINSTNNVACNLENCNNVVLKKNEISNTGTIAGMGDGDSGGYEGMLLSGNDQLIEGNRIDSSGYIAVTFRGENVVVKNNVIKDFSFVKDDGSGIYTWNNPSNPPVYSGRIIKDNIVLNGLGAGAGTSDPENAYANGIYMDDNAGGVEISGNTVANCANYGLYIHNAHDLVITNNTIYNNRVQINMTQDDIAPFPIANVTLTGNTFVAKTAGQSVAEYKTNANNISNFGTFDNNYYSRPLFDNLQIGVLNRVNGTYFWNAYDLDSWKAVYGKDQNSKKSPFPIAPYKINSFSGSNLFANGNFDGNINGLYAYSSAGNASTTWNSSALDGGALQIAFSGIAGNGNKASVIIGVGAVSASKKYILSFSIKGTNAYKVGDAYLRQSNAGYADITPRNYFTVTGNRAEREILFTPSANESNASIGIDIPEQSGAVYLDNIRLTEANVTPTNPDDSIRLVYNAAAVNKSFSLNGVYADIANNEYSDNINLQPFSSAVLLKKSPNQPPPPPEAECLATGNILREYWNNIGGNDISSIPLQTPPSGTGILNIFEAPINYADNYGARIRGYVCPPQTGNYTFWVASDDASELWLSTDDNPANKTKIAYALSWTNSREWNKYPTQKSGSIYLQAGRRYYIEALQKEGGGGDNLAVAWQLPNGGMEAPIPGMRLSPFLITIINQTINFAAISPKTYGDAPFTIYASTTSGLPVSFNIVSGPGTLSGNMVTITGTGAIVIRASQDGNSLYSASAPVNQTVIVSPAQTINCTATGSILREQWDNIGGYNISSIPLQNAPVRTMQLTSFESPTNYAENFGTRIRGYICPPQTGNYTFWIAADDVAELWLGTNATEMSKLKIAEVTSYTGVREWYKYASQKSATIYLEAGKRYYIEALHKEAAGGDHLAVAWQLPDGVMEAPLPGVRLSPFIVSAPVCIATGNILREQWNNISGHAINSIPIQTAPAESSLLASFESPTNYAENYGARIRGYICPPQTGNYTFWIAADDAAELWLGTNDAELSKVKIAEVTSYTGVREWYKYVSQKSATIYLQAGQRYYIEALHKEGIGGDHLAVAWQLPDGVMQAPLPGSQLSPFTNAGSENYVTASSDVSNVKVQEELNSNRPALIVYPNPLKTVAVIDVIIPDNNAVKLELYDEQGRMIKPLFTGLLDKNVSKRVTLNAEALTNGIYILRLATQSGNISKKIIIQK